MAQTRIIPGVAIKVVKDVVAPQLSPAGVLGLVGLVEKDGVAAARAASWNTFVETFGAGSAQSLPEARQALENGVTELVVIPVAGGERASVDLGAGLTLEARAPGTWANDLSARVTWRRRGGEAFAFDLEILRGQEVLEKHGNLSILPGLPRSVGTVLASSSSRVRVKRQAAFQPQPISNPSQPSDNPIIIKLGAAEAVKLGAEEQDPPTFTLLQVGQTAVWALAETAVDGAQATTLFTLPGELGKLLERLDGFGKLSWGGFPPEGGAIAFSPGADADQDALEAGLKQLDDYADVDLVVVSVQDQSDLKKRRNLYSKVIAHCENMAADAKGRIGFGELFTGATPAQGAQLVESLVSDRFVLVSPQGVLGAVAGRVGSLSYFESPTFKTLAGVGELNKRHGHEDQQTLLNSQIVPVVVERGRGLIIVRGLTTDSDQVSVRRVADRAVRGVKLIGDLFIGKLNNDTGRSALKAKLGELLMQMEKDGALVPSTDGALPAYQVAVYSSQDDFSKGIVHVDIAVRPVRAIDYIYATIQVQV